MVLDNAHEKHEVLIKRHFNASPQRVFEAWASKDGLLQWFAPPQCHLAFKLFEFREGGQFLSCITTPDQKECWCLGTYRRIRAPELIEFSMAVSNSFGEQVAPQDAGMDPNWPQETVVTVTFQPVSNGTDFTLRQTVSEELARRTGAYPSWLLMLDQLEPLVSHSVVV